MKPLASLAALALLLALPQASAATAVYLGEGLDDDLCSISAAGQRVSSGGGTELWLFEIEARGCGGVPAETCWALGTLATGFADVGCTLGSSFSVSAGGGSKTLNGDTDGTGSMLVV